MAELEEKLALATSERAQTHVQLQEAGLRLQAAREREETTARSYRALAERTRQQLASCPRCRGPVRGDDLLVSGHCPNPNCDPLPPAPVPTGAASPVTIRLQPEHPSPWTDRPVSYFPDARTLYRDSQWFRVPGGLAATIQRDAGIAPPAGSSGGGGGSLPWAPVGAGLAAILLAAAVGLALRTRRSRPSPSRRRPVSR